MIAWLQCQTSCLLFLRMSESRNPTAQTGVMILAERCERHVASIGSVVPDAVAFARRLSGDDAIPGLSTGLRDLDLLTGGLRSGTLAAVGGVEVPSEPLARSAVLQGTHLRRGSRPQSLGT